MYLLVLSLLFSSFSLWAESNKEILNRLIKNEKHGKVIGTFDSPTSRNKFSAEYVIPETKLLPQDVLYFYIPEEYSSLYLARLGFSHRQKGDETIEWDTKPGLTSALVYSKSVPGDELRYWGGPSSGELGAKFAENSPYPEYDALYEWPKKGHRGLKNKNKVFDLIEANVIRIQNLGTDTVYFSKLNFEFIPSVPAKEEVYIFTPDSNFGDPTNMSGRFYGGGQRLEGTFPNALRLNSKYEYQGPKLPSHFSAETNELRIELPSQKRFSFIEIMCGDSRPDRVINRDGGFGSPGNAEVNVEMENSITGSKRMLMKNISIPPEGVIMISEINNQIRLQKGDRILITNKKNKSTLYIMAIRIGLDD